MTSKYVDVFFLFQEHKTWKCMYTIWFEIQCRFIAEELNVKFFFFQFERKDCHVEQL